MSQATVRPALAAGPSWLSARRTEALERFDAGGFPRPGDEDWRQTSVSAIADTTFSRPEAGRAQAPSPLAAPLGGPFASFVDGRLAETDARDARVLSLSRALTECPDLLEAHLAAVAKTSRRPFAALNTAFFEDGAVLVLPERTRLAAPVQVVHWSTGGTRPTATHPRLLVLAGEDSEATVVETFLGRAPARTLTNAVAELVLAPGALLHHVRVVDEGEAWHVGAVQAHQARDSRLISHNLCLGAALTRIDLGSVLHGKGAECLLHGLYLAEGRQHVDNHTFLEHAQPHCGSRELYKGILSGGARAVFNGRILVRQAAQKTDAKQQNRNLLLSGEATVYTRPQLEIYADDVKCTHGATIGRLDEQAMFYLRARGIGETEARALLLRAFAAEILEQVPVPALRQALEHLVAERLHLELEPA
jgi:Fe-S cluster assembly protein SufD